MKTQKKSAVRKMVKSAASRTERGVHDDAYRMLVEHSPVGVTIIQDERIVFANPALLEMSGYPLDVTLSLSPSDLRETIHPEDRDRIWAKYQDGMNGELDSTLQEARLIRSDGMIRWVQMQPTRITYRRRAAVQVAYVDITDRKNMEKALHESEEKYRAIVENSPNLIGIFQDGVLKYVNSAGILMLGWTYEELVSPSFDPIEKVVSQKSRSLLKENIGKRLRGEGVPPYEITLTKKDGSEVLVVVRAAKIIYNQKPAIEFAFDDITERNRVEEKLRLSEERYRSLVDRMLDGIYRSTHEGRFLDVNPAFVKIFQYSSKQEMLDVDIKKELYFSPEERGSDFLDTGQEEVEVFRMRRKDGSAIWVEDHGRYVQGEKGNVMYHEGILRDVTERKQMEEELRQYNQRLEELVSERTKKLSESEGRLRAIVDASPYPISVSDLLGNMIDCNQALVDMHHYSSKDEIIGKNGLLLFAKKDRDLVANWTESELREVSKVRPSTTREFTMLMKDDREFPAELSFALTRDASGKPVAIVALARDLTERYEYENRLRKAERMAAIGETAAMVAHDLRSPLQGITGAAYILKQKCSPTADPETMEMLGLIESGLDYADKIVKELLDYSREIRLQLAESTVRTVLDAALQQVNIPATVTIENLAEHTPSLLLDASKIQRVFLNLIVNAIEAMPNGGKLTISSRESNEFLEIKFIDTGEGISEKVMQTLWKPMETTKPRGIGLGLVICKGIVEAHGGSIQVETTVGKGSTFTVKLPIKHAQDTTQDNEVAS